jgi:hypothetical protein
MMVVVSFFASMMVVYGKKTMPLQFAALMVMTLSMENQVPIAGLPACRLFFLAGWATWPIRWRCRGSCAAASSSRCWPKRSSNWRATCASRPTSTTQARPGGQFNQLVRQQIVVADKQQASRDLILRDLHTKQDGLLVQVHLSHAGALRAGALHPRRLRHAAPALRRQR